MHPQDTNGTPSQSKSQFLGQFLLGGLDLEVHLDGLWGRRLKKVVNFFGKKVHPCSIGGFKGEAGEALPPQIFLTLKFVVCIALKIIEIVAT